MANPISITGSCFGVAGNIAKASIYATQLADQAEDARSDLDSLRNQMNMLNSSLMSISMYIPRCVYNPTPTDAPATSPTLPQSILDQLAAVLASCGDTMDKIHNKLAECCRDKPWLTSTWASYGQKDIVQLRDELSHFQVVLNIGIQFISSVLGVPIDTPFVNLAASTAGSASTAPTVVAADPAPTPGPASATGSAPTRVSTIADATDKDKLLSIPPSEPVRSQEIQESQESQKSTRSAKAKGKTREAPNEVRAALLENYLDQLTLGPQPSSLATPGKDGVPLDPDLEDEARKPVFDYDPNDRVTEKDEPEVHRQKDKDRDSRSSSRASSPRRQRSPSPINSLYDQEEAHVRVSPQLEPKRSLEAVPASDDKALDWTPFSNNYHPADGGRASTARSSADVATSPKSSSSLRTGSRGQRFDFSDEGSGFNSATSITAQTTPGHQPKGSLGSLDSSNATDRMDDRTRVRAKDRTTGKTPSRAADRTADRATDQTTDHTTERSAGRSNGRTAGRSNGDRTSSRTADRDNNMLMLPYGHKNTSNQSLGSRSDSRYSYGDGEVDEDGDADADGKGDGDRSDSRRSGGGHLAVTSSGHRQRVARRRCPRDSSMMSQFIEAVMYGTRDEVDGYLQSGINPNLEHQCTTYMPALTVAVLRNHYPLVELLLDAGADVDGYPTNDFGAKPVHRPLYEKLGNPSSPSSSPRSRQDSSHAVADSGRQKRSRSRGNNRSEYPWRTEKMWPDAALCTPLHAAVTAQSYLHVTNQRYDTDWDKRLQVIKLLLRSGANPHAHGCAVQRRQNHRTSSGLFCPKPHESFPIMEALRTARTAESNPDGRPMYAIVSLLLEAAPLRYNIPKEPSMLLAHPTDVAYFAGAKTQVMKMLLHPTPREPDVWQRVIIRCVERNDWSFLEFVVQNKQMCRGCYHTLVRAFATSKPFSVTRDQVRSAVRVFSAAGLTPQVVISYSYRGDISFGNVAFLHGSRNHKAKPVNALQLADDIKFEPKSRSEHERAFLYGELEKAITNVGAVSM